jgi:hypothetical protein
MNKIARILIFSRNEVGVVRYLLNYRGRLVEEGIGLVRVKEGNNMNYKVMINIPISNNEVPELREHVGLGRRDEDYPTLFERCNFWAGIRDENNKLIAFRYVCGMGLEHGYMEDIIVQWWPRVKVSNRAVLKDKIVMAKGESV